MTDTHRYPAHVLWSENDKGFIAVAPDLPGCSALAETQQKALDELQDAIHAWIEAARAARNPIPVPSARQSIISTAAKSSCACRVASTPSSHNRPNRKT